MEFDELLITTGVDALVRLAKERQRIELEEASSVLNIPQETIEDWARVLEEEGILRIEYRLTRIYLLWVKPTEEEVAQEKESFYEEKKGLETEVEQFKQKITAESNDLEGLQKSFGEFYAKVYAKMDSLEKMVSSVPASKTISEDMLAKYRSDLGSMETQLADTMAALSGIKKEMGTLGIGKAASPSEELMGRLETFGGELSAMQQEMEALRKRAAAEEGAGEVQMPSVKDIKKKFESLQKDFVTLRTKNAQMRQDMLSLHESSEILKSVAESIMGQEDKITTLRGEVAALSQEADRLVEKTNGVSSAVKQNVELIGRLGDSVDVAKGVLKKFPSQDKVMEDLDALRGEEETLAEKTAALEKLLEAVGGRQVTAKQFSELVKRMDEKSMQMRKDMDALETALQDEKSTYLTFQKIKERIVPSIEGYQQQLDAMEQKVGRIKQESSQQMEGIRQEALKLQQSLKGGQIQDVVKIAEEIRDKKKTMDEIKGSLDDLVTMSDNLTKRVTLLSREAKLLEIRMGGAPGAGPAPGGAGGGEGGAPVEEKGVRQRLELTREEEMEFRRKREELKKLIQKLWEE
ncbi:MAG: hypothetical protein AB1529_06020 [Candidatus Micrarchaeota archaeon]